MVCTSCTSSAAVSSSPLLHDDTVRAASGAGALEQAQNFTPQMVLLDIGLPDLDGFGEITD